VLVDISSTWSNIVATTSTKVFNLNGAASSAWTYDGVLATTTDTYLYGHTASGSSTLHQKSASDGTGSGNYKRVSSENGIGTTVVASLSGATISGTRTSSNSSGAVTSTVAINNSNAAFHGVHFFSGPVSVTRSSPTVSPQPGDLPPPPPPPPAIPQLPASGGYTKPTTALSGGVTGDEFLDSILQNRRAHLAETAQGFIDDAKTAADMAYGATAIGGIQEAVTGTTLTGRPLSNGQRAVSAVTAGVPPLGFFGKVGGKVGGKAVNETVEATARGVSRYTGEVAEAAGVAVKSADDVTKQGTSVLGHYPEYKNLAEEIGAKRFNIPDDVWKRMTPDEQWIANQKFLDRMITRGDKIRLATPIDKVKPGSSYEKELNYLFERGYTVSPDGIWLIKK
jgi:hypothetical protein